MSALEVHLEDQYLTCGADALLTDLHALETGNLGLRAARAPLPLGKVLARGGFGALRFPLRHEVLGLTYQSAGGLVEVGGTTVKNVSGYDLTRLLIGAGVDGFVRAHLRLRPLGEVALYALERPLPYATLRTAGWDFAWEADETMYAQGNAALEPPAGSVRVERGPQAARFADERGPLDLEGTRSPLERRVLDSLRLVARATP